MFQQITISTSSDDQGNQFISIRRYDNHGKLGYTGNQCGVGRWHRSSNIDRITAILRGMGYHHMHGLTYGKLVIA
jgi:hypothetical protein